MKRLILFTLSCLTATIMQAQEPVTCPIDTVNGTPLYRYTVEKSIGLYRISINFSVTQEDIIRYNPQLRDRGLHYGETIYIPIAAPAAPSEPVAPVAPSTPVLEQSMTPAVPADTVKEAIVPAVTPLDTVVMEPADTVAIVVADTISEGPTALRIGLLLPLHANTVDRTPIMERFFDFYQGVLLAVYDVQASGQPIRLDVFDTEKSDLRLESLIAARQLDSVDAIIGPAYPNQVVLIDEAARTLQRPVLIPFTDQVAGLSVNPWLMQFNAGDNEEAEAFAQWLESRRDSINCVLIDAPEADIPPSIRALRNALRAHEIPVTRTTIHSILADSLANALVPEVENIIIFNTEKYSNIQVLMPRLRALAPELRLTLFSRYAWLRESIPMPQVYTSEFDTELPADRSRYDELFNRYFSNEHASDLPRYDLLGYDLMRFLVAWLRGEEYFGLQSEPRMQRLAPEGGYINTNIHIRRR